MFDALVVCESKLTYHLADGSTREDTLPRRSGCRIAAGATRRSFSISRRTAVVSGGRA
jgi:hypothetical protein